MAIIGISFSGNVFAANTGSADIEASIKECFSIPDSLQQALDITGDITIEAWIKLESAPGVNTSYTIVSKYKQTGNNRSFQFFYYTDSSNSNYIGFYASPDGSAVSTWLDPVIPFTVNVWYHVAATLDVSEKTAKIYINSALHNTNTNHASSIFNSTAPLEIGAGGDGPNGFFDGKIDEVRTWNVVRSAQEIAANYQNELTPPIAGLVGYWPMNYSLNDLSTNFNNLSSGGTYSIDVPFTGSTTTTTPPPTTTTTTVCPCTGEMAATKSTEGILVGGATSTTGEFINIGYNASGVCNVCIVDYNGTVLKTAPLPTLAGHAITSVAKKTSTSIAIQGTLNGVGKIFTVDFSTATPTVTEKIIPKS